MMGGGVRCEWSGLLRRRNFFKFVSSGYLVVLLWCLGVHHFELSYAQNAVPSVDGHPVGSYQQNVAGTYQQTGHQQQPVYQQTGQPQHQQQQPVYQQTGQPQHQQQQPVYQQTGQPQHQHQQQPVYQPQQQQHQQQQPVYQQTGQPQQQQQHQQQPVYQQTGQQQVYQQPYVPATPAPDIAPSAYDDSWWSSESWDSYDSMDDWEEFDDELLDEDHLHPHASHLHDPGHHHHYGTHHHGKHHDHNHPHAGHHFAHPDDNPQSAYSNKYPGGGDEHARHLHQPTLKPDDTHHAGNPPKVASGGHGGNRGMRPSVKPWLFTKQWIHDLLSHLHAFLCVILYLGLAIKVHRDKMSLGVSPQAVFALFISELISFSIRASEFWNAGYFDISIIHTDLLSVLLALYCTYIVWRKFRVESVSHRRDCNLDAFGMNILSMLYCVVACNFSSSSSSTTGDRGNSYSGRHSDSSRRGGVEEPSGATVTMIWTSPDGERTPLEVNYTSVKKNGMHFGHLEAEGLTGALCRRVYWVILYIYLALPGALSFFLLRRLIGAPLTPKTRLVAFGDAVRAVALVPQLYMYEIRKHKRISEQLLLFAVCEGALKITALLFWLSYPLFHLTSRLTNVSRVYATVIQIVNLVMVVRFLSVLCSKPSGTTAVEKAVEMSIPLTNPPNDQRDWSPGVFGRNTARNRLTGQARL